MLQSIYSKFPQLNPDDDPQNSIFQIQKRGDDTGEDAKRTKTIFGLERTFFSELLIPKENTFENSIFDITVEGNRFLSYPYFFNDAQSSSGKKQSKATKKIGDEELFTNQASASPGSPNEDKPKYFKGNSISR